MSLHPERITVVIPCGGKATRLYPLTYDIPKALIPVDGKPVIEHIIERCKASGFHRFVLCEGAHAQQIQDHLGDGSRFGVQITHVVEPEPLGTGGAIAFARIHLSDPFLVVQGDVLFATDLAELLRFHGRNGADATLLSQKGTHPEDMDLHRLDADWRIIGIGRPAPGERFLNVANAGIMLLPKTFLEGLKMPATLERDVIAPRLRTHRVLSCFLPAYLQDMGTPDRLKEVTSRGVGGVGRRPGVILDRDGVLVVEKDRMTEPGQIELIPGVAEAIKAFNEAGIPVAVATNQAVVARGRCTEEGLARMHDRMRRLLLEHGAHVDGVFACVHYPPAKAAPGTDTWVERYLVDCDCRKPGPGLLRQAAQALELDLARSVMVGDKTSDIAAGAAAGCRTVLVRTGYGGDDGDTAGVAPDLVSDSLATAVAAIRNAANGGPFIGRAFVTGGAGFIGSHIVDRLLRDGAHVTIYDNFSTGQERFIAHHAGDPRVTVVRADVLDLPALTAAMAGCDFVFHLQANADVRGGIAKTRLDLEQNTIGTWNVLEAMRVNGVKRLMFSSSATVYGEPDAFPTPEKYAPQQTSLYGASKYAGEAMIQAFGEYYGIQSWTFRFVSWIGERYTHGVIFDFMKKLLADPRELEVLGDGKQRKSYLDVHDGVDGIFFAIANLKGRKNIVNLGHDDWMNVLELAGIVCDELGLPDVRLRTTGGERGWLGDAPFVHLDTSQLKNLGWSPRISIEEGIRSTVRYLQAHQDVLERRKVGGI